MKKSVDISNVAGVEYHGSSGVTQNSIDAIVHIINSGEKIKSAWLLSWLDGSIGEHSFFLNIFPARQVLIKPGFTSGYSGEGPRGLSTALQILQLHSIEIEEYEIDRAVAQRAEAGCLLSSDLEKLEKSRPIRPTRYYDYILRRPNSPQETDVRDIQRCFPAAINLGLLDERLVELAIGLFENPDSAISTAFRRLEDIVRDRIGIYDKSGSHLFKKAFEGDKSLLHWNDLDGGEQAGKAGLFVAIFLAYRNPRAHREILSDPREAAREFMLINQLYLLEASAVARIADLASYE
jgi:hypothetical protein